ncbi:MULTISPECIES: lipopolysaccharide ABC transporter substrate-binding protein LptA [Pantoea]|jgi:lipopolysaccharide export system protein LptA|uniref:Lipopolysaccharide export system protein LptA n=1 Tax=Pantoea eucrina TaxID=472693 RepID=A0ABS1Z4J5_9GAMM|nr:MULTISPECIES: lipopolysaccharide ABC transporter substrate-binding protein LptA [Pantoea]AIX50091.1 lipopolysaccharide transporter [Pantoea sp. PSNIH1]KAA6045504.1 lipopolysaccharide ABC transporter substrate-binding protein LptA [Pantoea sp. Bo_7]KAA6090852.1 lipopolysaccharide ABC transporter substrate-binding protein LptA [Pantoea sp. Bo_10]MBM0747324.1 lipopolysaccharide ABC transporter substrate-binding protein LptA [Pantoea eucrina]MCL9646797.1 lipopolysaccharide ABC transporter subst
MKFKMNKNSVNALLLGSLLIGSLPALAVTGDSEKPVNIDSVNQALDLQGNVATFTGNVIVTQGTIKITADKVVVTRPGGDSNKTIVDAYGNPATFYQMQDNGKPVKGHAAKLHYELANDFVELTGNAFIEQQDSNIKGDRITYLVKEQKMQAYSQGQSKRVTTVLVPSQLQDKNGSAASPKKSN